MATGATVNAAAQARLFLALWPDAGVRRLLARHRDGWQWHGGAGGRPTAVVRTDKLHLTLHFIGNVARERLPQLQAGLAVPCTGFELAFGQPALWPRGIAVIEPLTVPGALPALHAALADALHRLGLPTEARPFRPHVTLARHAQQAGVPTQAPAIAWRIDGYALVESRTDGAYQVLAHYPCRCLPEPATPPAPA